MSGRAPPSSIRTDLLAGSQVLSTSSPKVVAAMNEDRRAGEWITIAVMKAAVQMLAGAMEYVVPPQDTTIDLSRIPTLPASGFVIADVGVV